MKWFTSLIMPWFVLAATSAAVYSRVLRGSLIEAMGEDYIRTARAKGLRERRVIFRHGVRSAITPVVTIFGLDIGRAARRRGASPRRCSTSPGSGGSTTTRSTTPTSRSSRGRCILAALFIVIANIVVDIVYAYLDPRVRYS